MTQSTITTATTTTTIAATSPVPFHEGPSTTHEVSSSSTPPESSPPSPYHDAVSERLAMFLAQQQGSIPSSGAKGISIEEGLSRDDDSTMSELKKEISMLNQKKIELDIHVADLEAEKIQLNLRIADLEANKTLKKKQISDLQTHFSVLTTCYYDLKNKLAEELGEKFKSSVQDSLCKPVFSRTPC